jgi:CRP/FNR family cyclic AMP-dependent transcriptional regulator
VKVTRLEPNGEELLLALRGPGEVIGEITVLDGTGRSASVIALDSCIAYVLSAARFRRVVNDFQVEGMLLRHVIARYREGQGSGLSGRSGGYAGSRRAGRPRTVERTA